MNPTHSNAVTPLTLRLAGAPPTRRSFGSILSADEELTLAKCWREHRDQAAADRLVTSHLRLVSKIARGYRGYGLPIDELVSEGNLGLIQAVGRFDPAKGFRLATYAVWWIRAAIHDYILRSWSLVKIGTTGSQRKLFFKLRAAKSRLSALNEGDLRPDQIKLIAADLDVREQDVVEMNRRLGGDVSLNLPLRDGGDGSAGEMQDWLVDDSPNPEQVLVTEQEGHGRRAALRGALLLLNGREREIILARRLSSQPLKLEELSTQLGVSRERVRQIEARAFEKMQRAVKEALEERVGTTRADRVPAHIRKRR